MPDLVLKGTIVAVSADRKHRFSKPQMRDILLLKGHGIEGDAHAGTFVRHRYLARRDPRLPNLRQVHLIPCELFETLRKEGYDIRPGELGENITTAGLEIDRMPLGTEVKMGRTAIVELTGLRTPCMLIDRFRAGLKRRLVLSEQMGPPFRCGVLAVVRKSGRVTAGDAAHVILPDGPRHALPPL